MGGSSDTAILVGVILVLVVLAGVAVHAIVVDILQIMRTRKSKYSTESDRRAQLAALLEKERDDLDPEMAAKVTTLAQELGVDCLPDETRGRVATLGEIDLGVVDVWDAQDTQ